MPKTEVATIKVKGLSQYGFFVDGFEKGVYFSKQFKDQAKVLPGAELEVELYVADSGSKYLNKILGSVAHSPVKASVDTERAQKVVDAVLAKPKSFVPKFQKKEGASATMSKEEWQAKDRSQLIGGLCHDAAQLTLAALTVGVKPEEVIKTFNVILDELMALRAEVK